MPLSCSSRFVSDALNSFLLFCEWLHEMMKMFCVDGSVSVAHCCRIGRNRSEVLIRSKYWRLVKHSQAMEFRKLKRSK